MRGDTLRRITLDRIVVIKEGRRELNTELIDKLVGSSIKRLGLQHPITVRRRGTDFILIAGRHRLEAFKRLGRRGIMANVVSVVGDQARLWEISENLHRADLNALERAEQIAEWIKITDKVSVQSAPKPKSGPKGGRPEGGISAAARELGIEETDAKRAKKIASIDPTAKEASVAAGLANNRSALLKVSRETTADAQITKARGDRGSEKELEAESEGEKENSQATGRSAAQRDHPSRLSRLCWRGAMGE